MSASATSRYGITIRLEADKVDLADAGAEVREIHGTERISQLFQFEVHLVSPKILDPYALLASKVDIVFERLAPDSGPKEERRIHGILRQVRDRLAGGKTAAGMRWANEYVLQVVPPLWTASMTVTNDVYQKLSIPKIVAQLLEKQLLLKAGEDFEMKAGEYPELEFVVEHSESHLNFVSRLCEHVGIFYFFDGKKVVFGDKNEHFAKANPEKPQFRGSGQQQSQVFALEAQFRHVPAGFRVRDYNYRAPNVEVAADHTLDAGRLGHVNEYGAHVKDPAEAKKLAKVRAEIAAVDYQTFEGRSELPGLGAGTVTEIEGHHAEDAVKGKMVITEVSHRCVQPVFGRADGMQQHYENEFRAIPFVYAFRPAPLAKKPVVPGLVTAVVETESEEKLGAIDDEGCYRVNFHYDGRTNEPAGKRKPAGASRPVRMAQPNAGADRKFHFPLKSGTEVVIGCVNGDPDRPVILGAVPDKGAKSGKGFRDSAVIKDNKERIILKTNESELSIDDTQDKARWRTQVGDWQSVELIGEPEFGKSTKIPLAEKGYLFGSEENYTTTVNKGMTLESTTFTALQQMRTVLTKAKTVEFVGEDPGFEDWKKFDEALAKAVEFTRLLDDMLAETKKIQEARTFEKQEKAKKKHAAAKQKAAEKGPPEGGDDKDPPECEECKKKEKELQEALHKRDKAQADLSAASRKKADARTKVNAADVRLRTATAPKNEPARKAQLDAAKQELDAASQKETAAKEAADQAEADLAKKRLEADQAGQKCRDARKKQDEERAKKRADEEAKAFEEAAKQAEAEHQDVQKFWKRIDAQLKEGKATEAKDLDKADAPKEADKKDLWSKIAKDLADKSHKTHLADSQSKLKDASSSLKSSKERKAGDAGEIAEPYAISVSKDSWGALGGKSLFLFGDKHATLYSAKNAHIAAGDKVHVKADTGAEVSGGDWVFVTAGQTIDGEAGDKIQLVAKGSGGVTVEAKMGAITGKAMQSIDLTAQTSGVSITAQLANVDIKATAGQITGMGTAGISFSSPATFSASAGGAASMSAGGAVSISAGGAVSISAGGAFDIKAAALGSLMAGGTITCTTPMFNVIGTIAIAGVALL